MAQGKHIHCVLSHAVAGAVAKNRALDDALVAACKQDNREAAVVLLDHGASAASATRKVDCIADCLLARQLMWHGFDILSAQTPPWGAVERHRNNRKTLCAKQRLALARGLKNVHWDNDVIQQIATTLTIAPLAVYDRMPLQSRRMHIMLGTSSAEHLPGYYSTLRSIVEQVPRTSHTQSQRDCGQSQDWRYVHASSVKPDAEPV
jgi:hypothetical protein